VAQELGLLLSMVRLTMDEQQQAAADALQQAGAVLLPAFGAAADGGAQQQQQEVRLSRYAAGCRARSVLCVTPARHGSAAMLILVVLLMLMQQVGGQLSHGSVRGFLRLPEQIRLATVLLTNLLCAAHCSVAATSFCINMRRCCYCLSAACAAV
jgi:hypothetical protein